MPSQPLLRQLLRRGESSSLTGSTPRIVLTKEGYNACICTAPVIYYESLRPSGLRYDRDPCRGTYDEQTFKRMPCDCRKCRPVHFNGGHHVSLLVKCWSMDLVLQIAGTLH